MKNICRIVVFLLILGGLFAGATWVYQPYSNDLFIGSTTQFYEEPEDTIEVIFLGSSVAHYGFSPMELYENYGICSWNFGSNTQPIHIAYYWLKEAYSYQDGSMSTVVLDVAMLRKTGEAGNYKTGLFGMHLSMNKLQAVKDITDTFEDFLAYTVPLTAFHSRWSSLEETDFERINLEDVWSRGGAYTTVTAIESLSYDEIEFPAYQLVDTQGVATPKSVSLFYLEQIISFCEENDLKLILTKTPTIEDVWSDKWHNLVQQIADENDLTFIDFNYVPYIDEIAFDAASDVLDTKHLNENGSTKLSDWFGEYLTQYCGVTDVRGSDTYSFMEDELAAYKEKIQQIAQEEEEEREEAAEEAGEDARDLDAELELYHLLCADAYLIRTMQAEMDELTVNDYLDVFSEGDSYVILLVLEGDAQYDGALREELSAYGLNVLSTLESGQAYAGVVSGTDLAEAKSDVNEIAELSYEYFHLYVSEDSASVTYIDEECLSKASDEGLNMVIFDTQTNQVVCTVSFDESGRTVSIK